MRVREEGRELCRRRREDWAPPRGTSQLTTLLISPSTALAFPPPLSPGWTLLEPGKALENENTEGSSQEPGLWSEWTGLEATI